jgi:PAS domain S-box-containing protein
VQFELESGSNDIYKDLFDNAHDLIHFAKPDGTLLYANNAWVSTLRYGIEEIKQKTIYDLLHHEDLELFSQYRKAVLEGRSQPQEILIRLKTKDGERSLLKVAFRQK